MGGEGFRLRIGNPAKAALGPARWAADGIASIFWVRLVSSHGQRGISGDRIEQRLDGIRLRCAARTWDRSSRTSERTSAGNEPQVELLVTSDHQAVNPPWRLLRVESDAGSPNGVAPPDEQIHGFDPVRDLAPQGAITAIDVRKRTGMG